ncbi:MAG TPA: hypothetical protein VIV12_27925, partial [Streptosporangiaceae bacterium]
AYAAYALRAWLGAGPAVSARTRRFAKWSAIFSFALGMAGQVAYHLLAQAGAARAPGPVTTIVSCLPVLVLGMGTTLAHMLHADATAANTPERRTSGPDRAPAWSPTDQTRPSATRSGSRLVGGQSKATTETRDRCHRRTTDMIEESCSCNAASLVHLPQEGHLVRQ